MSEKDISKKTTEKNQVDCANPQHKQTVKTESSLRTSTPSS